MRYAGEARGEKDKCREGVEMSGGSCKCAAVREYHPPSTWLPRMRVYENGHHSGRWCTCMMRECGCAARLVVVVVVVLI